MNSLTASFPLEWFARVRQRAELAMLLLDAAAKRNLIRTIYELDENARCMPLFFEDTYRALMEVGPVLVAVDEHSPIVSWFLEEKKLFEAGMLLSSAQTLEEVALSLSKNFDAVSENGDRYLFRFYDPHIMSALVEDARTRDLPRILAAISSLIINYYDKHHQNVWGEFVKKDSPQIQKNHEPILLNDAYFTLFDNKRLRHAVNMHAVTYAKPHNSIAPTAGKQPAQKENPLFFVTKYYAEQSFLVSDELYDDTAERLSAYEEAYGIENFTYLAECDLLLGQAFPKERAQMHAILSKNDIFIGDRLIFCREIQEKNRGGHEKTS